MKRLVERGEPPAPEVLLAALELDDSRFDMRTSLVLKGLAACDLDEEHVAALQKWHDGIPHHLIDLKQTSSFILAAHDGGKRLAASLHRSTHVPTTLQMAADMHDALEPLAQGCRAHGNATWANLFAAAAVPADTLPTAIAAQPDDDLSGLHTALLWRLDLSMLALNMEAGPYYEVFAYMTGLFEDFDIDGLEEAFEVSNDFESTREACIRAWTHAWANVREAWPLEHTPGLEEARDLVSAVERILDDAEEQAYWHIELMVFAMMMRGWLRHVDKMWAREAPALGELFIFASAVPARFAAPHDQRFAEAFYASDDPDKIAQMARYAANFYFGEEPTLDNEMVDDHACAIAVFDRTLPEHAIAFAAELIRYADIPSMDAGEYLAQHLHDAAPLLGDLFEELEDASIATTGFIGELGTTEAEDFLLAHFDVLIKGEQFREKLRGLKAIASPKILAQLKSLWRPYQTHITSLIEHIAAITGDALPEEIREDRARAEAKDGMFFELICESCQHVFMHHAKTLIHFMAEEDEDTEGRTLEDAEILSLLPIIECPYCETPEQWRLDMYSRIRVRGILQDATEWNNVDYDSDPFYPIPAGDVRVRVAHKRLSDGTRWETFTEVKEHLQGYTDEHPEDATAWRRYGVFLSSCHEEEAAIAALKRCLELDPKELEAHYHLAALALKHGETAEAVGHAWEALVLEMDHQEEFQIYQAVIHLGEQVIGPHDRRAGIEITFDLNKMPPNAYRILGKPTHEVRLRDITSWKVLAALVDDAAITKLKRINAPQRTIPFLKNLFSDASLRGSDTPPPASQGTFVREEEQVGRNDPCPCGSGKKYKKCCMRK